ncbi:hypothetical protein ISCGN_015090 [Ixodes scapularis]
MAEAAKRSVRYEKQRMKKIASAPPCPCRGVFETPSGATLELALHDACTLRESYECHSQVHERRYCALATPANSELNWRLQRLYPSRDSKGGERHNDDWPRQNAVVRKFFFFLSCLF